MWYGIKLPLQGRKDIGRFIQQVPTKISFQCAIKEKHNVSKKSLVAGNFAGEEISVSNKNLTASGSSCNDMPVSVNYMKQQISEE